MVDDKGITVQGGEPNGAQLAAAARLRNDLDRDGTQDHLAGTSADSRARPDWETFAREREDERERLQSNYQARRSDLHQAGAELHTAMGNDPRIAESSLHGELGESLKAENAAFPLRMTQAINAAKAELDRRAKEPGDKAAEAWKVGEVRVGVVAASAAYERARMELAENTNLQYSVDRSARNLRDAGLQLQDGMSRDPQWQGTAAEAELQASLQEDVARRHPERMALAVRDVVDELDRQAHEGKAAGQMWQDSDLREQVIQRHDQFVRDMGNLDVARRQAAAERAMDAQRQAADLGGFADAAAPAWEAQHDPVEARELRDEAKAFNAGAALDNIPFSAHGNLELLRAYREGVTTTEEKLLGDEPEKVRSEQWERLREQLGKVDHSIALMENRERSEAEFAKAFAAGHSLEDLPASAGQNLAFIMTHAKGLADRERMLRQQPAETVATELAQLQVQLEKSAKAIEAATPGLDRAPESETPSWRSGFTEADARFSDQLEAEHNAAVAQMQNRDLIDQHIHNQINLGELHEDLHTRAKLEGRELNAEELERSRHYESEIAGLQGEIDVLSGRLPQPPERVREDKDAQVEQAEANNGRWTVQQYDAERGVYRDTLTTDHALAAYTEVRKSDYHRVLDNDLKDVAADYYDVDLGDGNYPRQFAFHARSTFEREVASQDVGDTLQSVLERRAQLDATVLQRSDAISEAVDKVHDTQVSDADLVAGYATAARSYAEATRERAEFEQQPSENARVTDAYHNVVNHEATIALLRHNEAAARGNGNDQAAQETAKAREAEQAELARLLTVNGVTKGYRPPENVRNEIEVALSKEQIDRLTGNGKSKVEKDQEADASKTARVVTPPPLPNISEGHNQVRNFSAFADAGAKDKLIPEDVAARYKKDGQKFLDANDPKKVAFVDKGNRLQTSRSFDDKAVEDMVAIAHARGMTAIKVSGDEGFRRKAWIEGTASGMDVTGYEPTEKDKLRADQLAKQTGRANAIEKNEVVEAYRAARDGSVQDKKEAAKKHPELANAFALEQAAKSFAKQRLAPESQEKLVSTIRDSIERDLAQGKKIPEVRLRQERERRQDRGAER